MKKIISCVLVVFFLTLTYLHQRVLIYVEAYRIEDNYRQYNKFIDVRDEVVYNLSTCVSIDKVNAWAQDNNFHFPDKEKVFVLNREEKQKRGGLQSVTLFINDFFNISAPGSEALADTE